MKILSILFFLLLLSIYSLTAQFDIAGKVLNSQNEPLAFAMILVYPLGDSTNIRGTISETTGHFIIPNLSPKNYKIVIQMLGFKDWEQDLHLTESVFLDKIILKDEMTTLEAIEVVAQQSTLESRLGKKVLRIGQDLSTNGSNALEALNVIPSVSTTQQGEVQIRGSSNVIIYINGKETRRDPATLKYISAEVLEKIEVITNPSAKYDAEGVAGIINLVYKKGKTSKFKLEAIANLGVLTNPLFLSPNGGLNASFTKEKFSFFTNVSLDYGNYENYSNTFRKNFRDDLSLYESHNTLRGKGLVSNYNLGLSYEPDSTLVMGLEVNYDRWDFKNTGLQESIFNYRNQPTESFELTNKRAELENELWMNYTLEKTFKAKQNLKISLTTGGEDEANHTNNEEVDISTFPENAQQFLLSSDERESQRYYQGNLDFSTPFFNFGKLEAGIKADFIDYHILQSATLRSAIRILPDNDFTMNMQKVGVYLLQTHQIEKLDYAIGLRMEQFSSEALQRTDQSQFTQNYLRFFPSVQFNYLLPDNSHTIGFSYTRRINRPGFFDINPYISYEDPLNLETGNPALRPEIANLYELTYHKEMDKLGIDLTLYRRETSDVIQDIVAPLGNEVTLTSTINLGEQINQGLEGQLEYRPNKIIKTTATYIWSQVQFKDSHQEISFDKQMTWSVRLVQQLQLSHNWKVELSENYRAPRYQAQRKTHEQFYINIGINKKFQNKRGVITFSIRDIFNTREYIYSLHTANFEVQKNYKWQTRQITLGLRYNIFNG